jgi:hypothetical protein
MRERQDQRNAASANAVTNFNDTMGQRRAQREAAQAAAAVADVPAATRRAVPENDPLIGSGGRQFDAQRAPVPGIDPIPAHGGPVDPQLQADREAARSQSEVAGTFSAMALSGMGFGSNLQQRQLEALNRIADNTSDMETGLVAE